MPDPQLAQPETVAPPARVVPEPKTKVVCTIGPASRDPATLRRLMLAGMNVARLNFSHGTHEEHARTIADLRREADDLCRPLAILQDLSGPKIRIGAFAEGAVRLIDGDRFTLTSREVPGDASSVTCTYAGLADDVEVGDQVLLADGALALLVEAIEDGDVVCRVQTGGLLSSHKGIHLPSRSVSAASLTDKDRADLEFGLAQGVDMVALSFVRRAQDVRELRRIVRASGHDVPIIAKIEKHEALLHLDAILAACDAVMVARGDLGVEVELESVPRLQKRIIDLATRAGRPVITATQMLLSMVKNPRPSRAEVTDVANAILDGSDAVMLSEETAAGEYPVEAVEVMTRVSRQTETIFPHRDWLGGGHGVAPEGIAESVGHAACELAETLDAAAIVTFTESGSTACAVARCRPRRAILAVTPRLETYRRLALVWGVFPILTTPIDNTDAMMELARRTALESGRVRAGQRIVITAGVPVGQSGTTNMIKVEVVEEGR